MDLHLAAKIRCFFVANLRNSWLLRAMCASNQRIFISNLYGPDLFKGSSSNVARAEDPLSSSLH